MKHYTYNKEYYYEVIKCEQEEKYSIVRYYLDKDEYNKSKGYAVDCIILDDVDDFDLANKIAKAFAYLHSEALTDVKEKLKEKLINATNEFKDKLSSMLYNDLYTD